MENNRCSPRQRPKYQGSCWDQTQQTQHPMFRRSQQDDPHSSLARCIVLDLILRHIIIYYRNRGFQQALIPFVLWKAFTLNGVIIHDDSLIVLIDVCHLTVTIHADPVGLRHASLSSVFGVFRGKIIGSALASRPLEEPSPRPTLLIRSTSIALHCKRASKLTSRYNKKRNKLSVERSNAIGSAEEALEQLLEKELIHARQNIAGGLDRDSWRLINGSAMEGYQRHHSSITSL